MINTLLLHFKEFRNPIGALTPIEANEDIPFPIRRVYYITAVPHDAVRGFHAHRELEQVLICPHGRVKIRIKNPYKEEIVELNDPTVGLFIGPMIWREMFDFSNDAVLLVLASQHFSQEEYIRDWDVYEKEAICYFNE